MRSRPVTIVNVSVEEYCFSKKQIKGFVEANQFRWTFTWSFNKGLLLVNPSLKSTIEDALLRFLLKKDYELEAGNEYSSLFQPSFSIQILIQSKLYFAKILQNYQC